MSVPLMKCQILKTELLKGNYKAQFFVQPVRKVS